MGLVGGGTRRKAGGSVWGCGGGGLGVAVALTLTLLEKAHLSETQAYQYDIKFNARSMDISHRRGFLHLLRFLTP